MSMRVLHIVATGQRRGAELFAADLARALAEAGVDQRVAILRDGLPTAVPYEVPTVSLAETGRQIPALRVYLRAVFGLRRLMSGWEPDVVQAHGGQAMKHAVAARAGSHRGRVVYRRIGNAPPQLRAGVGRAAYGALVRRTDRIVAVAEAVRQESISLFDLRPPQIVTIPNGVDRRRIETNVGRDEFRRALNIPPDARVLLSLGALVWEKDPLTHIEVGAQILREVPGTFHLIAGAGPLRPAMDMKVQALGLDGRIKILGARADVADLLTASDLLLFASRTSGMEGMPGTIIEAGMMGLPVAAYAVSGVPEVVLDRSTGRLVAPDDVDALVRQASALLTDDSTRRAMGEAARERYRALFDIRAIAPRYLDLYEQVVSIR